MEPHGLETSRVTKSTMGSYRIDNFMEYAQTKRGMEDVALTVLAAGCVAGIVFISRL